MGQNVPMGNAMDGTTNMLDTQAAPPAIDAGKRLND
jgi:hypothetical protein